MNDPADDLRTYGLGIIDVSQKVMHDLLLLPDDYTVLEMYVDDKRKLFCVLVRSERLAGHTGTSSIIPHITPIYRKDNGVAKLVHIEDEDHTPV